MKNLIYLLFTFILVYSCKSEPTLPPDTYQVTVVSKDIYNGVRSHLNIANEKRELIATDTAMFVNGQVTFTGKITNPVFRLLTINGVNESVQFILEPGIINIELDKEQPYFSKIDGSENNKLFNRYKEEINKRAEIVKELRQQGRELRKAVDTTGYAEISARSKQMRIDLDYYAHEFIEEYPNSDFSLLLLETMLAGGNQDLEKFKQNINSLNDVINKNSANKLIGQKLLTFIKYKEAIANTEVGKIAPDFTSYTPDGKELSLNEVKGKATIIDFWASWCKPCRLENPNVVRVYEKYKDKGLEIISVSLDRENQKDRWLQAIEQDNLNWHHVSSLKYFNDPVAQLYNVNAIPSTFILDENGKIVAKKLRGQALENQIARLLD